MEILNFLADAGVSGSVILEICILAGMGYFAHKQKVSENKLDDLKENFDQHDAKCREDRGKLFEEIGQAQKDIAQLRGRSER